MGTTLDDEFKKTLRECAHVVGRANERYALGTIRIVSTNMDGDDEIWNLSAAEAESRARKYRMIAAHALRGASLCDDYVEEERGQFAELVAS